MNNLIVILASGIKMDENGSWMSTGLIKKESIDSAPGGKLRIIAGYYLYRDNPIKIMVMGGIGNDRNIKNIEHPTISEILKRELIELGIPQSDILEESKSINTYSQLQELIYFMKNNNIDSVDIISNDYHLPRIKAMIENIPEFQSFFNKNNFNLLSAEQVCLKYDELKWKELIENAYDSESMKKRIELEEKGINDLIGGEYKIK